MKTRIATFAMLLCAMSALGQIDKRDTTTSEDPEFLEVLGRDTTSKTSRNYPLSKDKGQNLYVVQESLKNLLFQWLKKNPQPCSSVVICLPDGTKCPPIRVPAELRTPKLPVPIGTIELDYDPNSANNEVFRRRVLGGTSTQHIPNVNHPERRSQSRGSNRPTLSIEQTDIPDAKDDDVIARQLREAALAEKDPDLREALWEELRVYLQGD